MYVLATEKQPHVRIHKVSTAHVFHVHRTAAFGKRGLRTYVKYESSKFSLFELENNLFQVLKSFTHTYVVLSSGFKIAAVL